MNNPDRLRGILEKHLHYDERVWGSMLTALRLMIADERKDARRLERQRAEALLACIRGDQADFVAAEQIGVCIDALHALPDEEPTT
jgi:hypothetical protein